MVRICKLFTPLWSLSFLFFLLSCGKVDTPNVADPYANITGKSLGFDVNPPFFENDASGNQKGLDLAVPGGCGNILLQWSNASDDVSLSSNISYFIYQATSSGGENFNVPAYQVPARNTDRPQYLVKNLSPNTTYYFVVRARDEAGNLSVIDPNHLVERSAATQGTRIAGGAGPNLYCPGGYAGETAVFTGTSVGNATTAIFSASLSPVPAPTSAISTSEVRAGIPSGIQSGSIQLSPSGGTTADRFLFFPSGTNISNDATASRNPSIAVSGTNIGMAWTDSYQGKERILFSLSTNGGGSFSSPASVSDPLRFSSSPQIVFGSGANPPIYLVWSDQDATGNNSDIYFSSSLTNGASFSTPVNLSLNGGTSLHPRIAFSGNPQNTLSVVWEDNSVLYGLTSVWGSTMTDVYAVGKGGNIYHTADQGKSWVKQQSNISSNLKGVWGSSAGDVYAVGSGGVILHTNNQGLSWTTTTGTANTLNAVWGSGATDVYAVGTGGTILHFNGMVWVSTAGIPNTITFNAVWGSGATDVYAAGNGGIIYHSNGTTWSAQTSTTSVNLNGIWGSGSTDIYIAGDQGTILYSSNQGATWAVQSIAGFATDLKAIWGTTYLPSGTTVQQEAVYAGGAGDKIIKKIGASPVSSTIAWDTTSVAISGSFTVTGLWGLVTPGASNIYGVQGNGSIVQWNGANWQYLIPESTMGEIFYLQSLDGGATFSPAAALSSAYTNSPPHQALQPDLVQSGSNLTVAWAESQSGIHLVQSANNGAGFSPPNQLISPLQSTSFPQNPRLLLSVNGIYLTWEDTTSLASQVRMTLPAFQAAGLSVFPSSRFLSTSGTATHPSLTYAAATNTLAVVWVDLLQQKKDNNVPQSEIFLISSPDGGVSFTPPVNFSSTFQDSSDNPILVNDGTNIFMAWEQQMPPAGSLPQNAEIFFSHF